MRKTLCTFTFVIAAEGGMKGMTNHTPSMSYRDACAEMGRLQMRGYVTSIPMFDGWGWYVGYMTWAEYEEVRR